MTGKEYNEQFTEEELKTEIWKDILNYGGYYQVSNLGRVKSLSRLVNKWNGLKRIKERIMIPRKGNNEKESRFSISLSIEDNPETISVHKLVLETFVCKRPEGMECCHNDGNPLNNRLSNLRWDTPHNNQLDRIIHGTYQYGEKNASSKLKNNDVIGIREMYKTGKYTQRFLANKFNINYATLCNIVNNKTWKHLL